MDGFSDIFLLYMFITLFLKIYLFFFFFFVFYIFFCYVVVFDHSCIHFSTSIKPPLVVSLPKCIVYMFV